MSANHAVRQRVQAISTRIEHRKVFETVKPDLAAIVPIVRRIESENDALAARCARLWELACAESDFSTALVDLLTDEQVNSAEYPHGLDLRIGELVAACRMHGDLDAGTTGAAGRDGGEG